MPSRSQHSHNCSCSRRRRRQNHSRSHSRRRSGSPSHSHYRSHRLPYQHQADPPSPGSPLCSCSMTTSVKPWFLHVSTSSVSTSPPLLMRWLLGSTRRISCGGTTYVLTHRHRRFLTGNGMALQQGPYAVGYHCRQHAVKACGLRAGLAYHAQSCELHQSAAGVAAYPALLPLRAALCSAMMVLHCTLLAHLACYAHLCELYESAAWVA